MVCRDWGQATFVQILQGEPSGLTVRHAYHLLAQGPAQEHLRRFDLCEIDARPASFWTRRYRRRIDRVVAVVQERLRPPSLTLDLACAQGNVAITLGELGYRVIGVDLRKEFLDYARSKDDQQVVTWVVAECMDPPLASGRADAVVMGEVLEHVAHPGRLLTRALELVRVGGLVICTTPNGASLRNNRLPSYEKARQRLPELEARQFGPEGADHLFALRPGEIRRLVPPNAQASLEFKVSTLWNRVSDHLARWSVAGWLLDTLSELPFWRRWLSDSLILVLEKTA